MIFSLFRIILFPSLSFSLENSPPIRILLAKNIHTIQVTSDNALLEHFSPSGKIKKKPLRASLKLCLNKNKSRLERYNNLIYRLKGDNPESLLYWEDKPFRGELLIYKNTTGNYCDLVNVIPLEKYLQWLLAKEMNAQWPLEALKAQAIAARSYALHRIQHHLLYSTKYYDLENSQKDQVSGDVRDENENTKNAIMETLGQVLISPSTQQIIPGFFHSKCGGQTLVPDKIWPRKIHEIVGVKCPFCHSLGMGPWVYYGEKDTLLETMKKLNAPANPDVLITLSDLDTPKNHTFYNVKKSSIRNIFGVDKVPSNQFKIAIEQKERQFKLIGFGHGHGVGLCQFGALKMAQEGRKALDIVQFYFPKLKIERR